MCVYSKDARTNVTSTKIDHARIEKIEIAGKKLHKFDTNISTQKKQFKPSIKANRNLKTLHLQPCNFVFDFVLWWLC